MKLTKAKRHEMRSDLERRWPHGFDFSYEQLLGMLNAADHADQMMEFLKDIRESLVSISDEYGFSQEIARIDELIKETP